MHAGAYYHGVPAAILRGGSFTNGRDAGAFAVNAANSPANADTVNGFRCCAGGR
ncbi:hypothetical protein L6R52_21295 [Myxococcota bacterium]|nr:hypothetical protein [Myxococcota bacterium]